MDGARSPSPRPGLPPVPDAVTGEPAPPRAPRVAGPWAGHPRTGRRVRSWRPAARKLWGRGFGGALESVSARQQHLLRDVISMGAITFVLLSGLMYALNSKESGFSINEYTETIPITLLIWLPCTIFYYFTARDQKFYAGSTWIAERDDILDENDSIKPLNTYELGEIVIRQAERSDATLRMVGRAADESVTIPLGLLEGNPRLWDYVYNGLVHSAANGARIDAATRNLLHLAGPGGSGV